jgi:hypothetical protein
MDARSKRAGGERGKAIALDTHRRTRCCVPPLPVPLPGGERGRSFDITPLSPPGRGGGGEGDAAMRAAQSPKCDGPGGRGSGRDIGHGVV